MKKKIGGRELVVLFYIGNTDLIFVLKKKKKNRVSYDSDLPI
jgi:hypothetical protein